MEITIQFCTLWDYVPDAVSLTEELLRAYGRKITGLTLQPAGSGAFEVSFNGELIFSKKRLDRFPEKGEIQRLIAERR